MNPWSRGSQRLWGGAECQLLASGWWVIGPGCLSLPRTLVLGFRALCSPEMLCTREPMQVVLGVLLEAMGLSASDHTGTLATQLQVWSLLMCGDPRANSPFQGVGGLKSVAGQGLCC